MLTVRRIPLPPSDYFEMLMPARARLLEAAPISPDHVALWILAEDGPLEPRRFLLTATNVAIDTRLELVHVSTFVSPPPTSVEFHLFEVKGKPIALANGSLRATR